MKSELVSIIIPTKNSAEFLGNCLKSIRNQTYKKIEIIIVDGKSTDNTYALAKKYKCKVYTFTPQVKRYSFDASYKRNYGAKKAIGKYIYWADADMELPKNLTQEAVDLCEKGAGAVILPEDSFGTGIWARAKNLERRCYWGDDTVECPRFFKRSVWEDIEGFDESLGAGGDDLDIHQKVLDKGYRVARTKSIVMHNEGHLKLKKLFKKHFMYGLDTIKYFQKRPRASAVSYFPLRIAYFKNLGLFFDRPLDACLFIVMRSIEYTGSFLGLLYSLNELFFAKKTTRSITIEEYAHSLPQYYDTAIPKILKKYLDMYKFTSFLDGGCGDGSLLFALREHNYFRGRKIQAIDLSRNRIEIVKKIDDHIYAVVDNVETMKRIKSNSIDFFASSYVIEHVNDNKMIKAVARVLKKGGIAYISTIFKKSYGWYYHRKNGAWVMDVTHLREYTKDEELFSLIDNKIFIILEQQKKQLFFPIMDFFIRRLAIKNRQLFVSNVLLKFLRYLTVPIPGYNSWEIILQRK